ncbi:sulfatase family protein [Aquimarina agarivorans]|uniref:sulfatase family protein n=1 Tax=Aquimarina agarivorans TaxID=980584 RepID=UPI0003050270|nr:sulfatase [Aquimarina agarivorans]
MNQIYKLIAFGIMLTSVACNKTKQPIQKQPNIVYIMADDHTTQGIGVYQSRLAGLNPSPNIDKIGKSGIIFDRCYVTNSICTPSRAAILTGQYSQANGVIDLEGVLPKEKQFLPTELKKLGYQTAIVGKWHLHDEPAAFDYYCVFPVQGKYFDPEFRIQGSKPWPQNVIKRKGHSSDNVADLTLDWLKNKRDPNKPFLLMPQFKAPHDDFEFAPRYKDYLKDKWIPEPASMYYNANNGSVATRGKNDSLTRIIGSSVSRRNIVRHKGMSTWKDKDWKDFGNAQDLKATAYKPFNHSSLEKAHTSRTYQEFVKRYLRCVKGVDDNVKRIMDYLEVEGLLENTVVIYTGDQGFMLGEHDYVDKRWMYEESMRMPLLIQYPTMIKPNQRSGALINNTDFTPTMLALAGGTVPNYMQGKSFKSILETGKEPENWRDATYYRYWMHMAHRHANPAHFGIRTKDYKLIFCYGKYWVDTDDENKTWNKKSWGNDFTRHTPVAWEFYDMNKDPKEMNNVYNDPAYASIIRTMKKKLKKTRAELNEGDEKYPHIQKVIDQHWDD